MSRTILPATALVVATALVLARVPVARGQCDPAWSPDFQLPQVLDMNGCVRALAVIDLGAGPALYAGGDFTTAGAASASHVATWDGSTWKNLFARPPRSPVGSPTRDDTRPFFSSRVSVT